MLIDTDMYVYLIYLHVHVCCCFNRFIIVCLVQKQLPLWEFMFDWMCVSAPKHVDEFLQV